MPVVIPASRRVSTALSEWASPTQPSRGPPGKSTVTLTLPKSPLAFRTHSRDQCSVGGDRGYQTFLPGKPGEMGKVRVTQRLASSESYMEDIRPARDSNVLITCAYLA